MATSLGKAQTHWNPDPLQTQAGQMLQEMEAGHSEQPELFACGGGD